MFLKFDTYLNIVLCTHFYCNEIFTGLFIDKCTKATTHVYKPLVVLKWKTSFTFSWFHIQDMMTCIWKTWLQTWRECFVHYIQSKFSFKYFVSAKLHISYKDNTFNMNRKSIQIDLKWLFWDKIGSILNWFKHTEDKMVKLKVLLVRRSYTLEYDTWNGILARVLQSWSGLGEGYDTWGYHISTYIIQEYIISENTHWVCELIICAHNHTIQNTIYVIIWI